MGLGCSEISETVGVFAIQTVELTPAPSPLLLIVKTYGEQERTKNKKPKKTRIGQGRGSKFGNKNSKKRYRKKHKN